MNQAIKQSELVNGPKEYWDVMDNGLLPYVENGNKILPEIWFEKYLKDYLSLTEYKVNEFNKGVMVYFSDGSMALIGAASVKFYPWARDFAQLNSEEDGTPINRVELSGIKYFTFFLNPSADVTTSAVYSKHTNLGLEPYMCYWNGEKDLLWTNTTNGCSVDATNERAYCTKIIQMNGWKIPKDYPFAI